MSHSSTIDRSFSSNKGRCTKTKANHQTQMEESVITNIALEKDIRSILADSIRNIPVTADEICQESTKDAVFRKAMNYVQKKWPAPPVQGESLDLYNRQKALSVIDSCLMFKESRNPTISQEKSSQTISLKSSTNK